MPVRRVARQPLYSQIADQLRDAMQRGELAPGEQLPTEQQLMERYDVSRNTVRLALGALTNEGLISSSQGRGSFVRERTPLQYFASRTDSHVRREQLVQEAFLSDAEEQGRAGRIELDVAIVRAAPEFATRLQLDDNAIAVVRRRVQYVDDQPYALADSYFPYELVRDTPIAQPDNIPQGANKVLDELGHVQVRFRDEITTRMPTAEEARRLDIGPGTPVAQLIRTAFDQDDQPVRLAATILPGDRYVLVYDVDGN
ncbi:MAG: GntR family transcriptional regulator [Thermoleophilaceae bacterium]|nr:GntR family transcriptional regulator [Thermoleophilaceae bacterium]